MLLKRKKKSARYVITLLIISIVLTFCACDVQNEDTTTQNNETTVNSPTVQIATKAEQTDPAQTSPVADEVGKTDEYSYEVFDNKAYISGYSGDKTDITIPTAVDKYAVFGIKEKAFAENKCGAKARPGGRRERAGKIPDKDPAPNRKTAYPPQQNPSGTLPKATKAVPGYPGR